MKRLLILALTLSLCLALTACGGNSGEDSKEEGPYQEEPSEPSAPDLSGEWRTIASTEDDTGMGAYIDGEKIEVYWLIPSENMTALYWAGSFSAPESAEEPYKWTSNADKDRNSSALMASTDDTKDFTYDGGTLTCSVTAFGVTQEMEFQKEDWGYVDSFSNSASEGTAANPESDQDAEVESSGWTVTQKNVMASAKSYLNYSGFSYKGLIEQLEYEKYTHEDAVWAADNCNADWNEEALESAKSYIDYSGFSYTGLIGQLEYEGFTTEQATYGADNCGADWNEEAAEAAKSYLSYTSFSRDGLIDQLEYEGFTHEQAVYGADQNGL